MIFFPFRSKVYKTNLTSDEIFNRLQKSTSLSNSDTGEKNEKGSTLEMTSGQDSFVIGKSTGGTKHGLMNTDPVVKGKLKTGDGFTHVKITIGPRSFILPVVGLIIVIPAVYFGITKFDVLTFLLAVVLVVMMYSDLVIKFNRLYKVYLEMLDSAFQEHAV